MSALSRPLRRREAALPTPPTARCPPADRPRERPYPGGVAGNAFYRLVDSEWDSGMIKIKWLLIEHIIDVDGRGALLMGKLCGAISL